MRAYTLQDTDGQYFSRRWCAKIVVTPLQSLAAQFSSFNEAKLECDHLHTLGHNFGVNPPDGQPTSSAYSQDSLVEWDGFSSPAKRVGA